MIVVAQVHIVPNLKALIYINFGHLKAKVWWYFCYVSEPHENMFAFRDKFDTHSETRPPTIF